MASEVSCRVLGLYLEVARRLQYPLEKLCQGLGVTPAQIADPSHRIDWDTFCQLSERLEVLCGGPAGLENAGVEFAKDNIVRGINTIFGLLSSARSIYWASHRWFGQSMFTITTSTFEDLEDGRIRMTLTIPDSYRDCPQLFRINVGVYQIVPRMLGQPDARVSLQLAPRKGVFLIDPPPSLTLWARLRRRLRLIGSGAAEFDELTTQTRLLRERYEELEVARAELARNADQLHTINEAGKELSRHTELSALGEAVSQLLYTRFSCTGLRLWLARHPGDPLTLARESGSREGPWRAWDLQSGGELLGRIEAWNFSDSDSGLFDGLIPWISIALNNARSFALVKEAQEELERRVEERTHELSQTTAKLQDSVRQLTEMDQQKTQFFANASHELRTPLTLMILPVESLLSSAGLPAEMREKLDGVLRGGYRLLKLINDLLDLSKIEAGKMQLRMGQVDLSRLLEDVVRPWRAVLARRNVELQLLLPSKLPLIADSERLEQVALNLMSNAVKHVPDGGTLVVGATPGPQIRFFIENTGEGIDPREVDRIFERFGQSSSSKGRRFGSTGLGLPLVKDLVELHSGRISVHNEPGQRVRFEVSLPSRAPADGSTDLAPMPGAVELRQYEIDSEAAAPPPTWDAPPLADPEDAAERPVLLLVEDNADLRGFLAQHLRHDYQVVEASDGAMGLKLAGERHPDIVLSDLMMPEMDGMELCRALKANPTTSGVPFVLLTARGDLNTKLEGLDTGADDFLVKPFHLTEVQTRLRTQLRIRRMSEQLAHAEKLVALGTVVAGVAHEVRNPLNGIINALVPVKEMMNGGSPEASELVELALGAARRVEALTVRLLQQVRAGEASESFVDVRENVQLAIQLLQHKATTGPRLVHDFSGCAADPRVFGDSSSLNQVWVNLIDNAIHAAGKAGTVRVTIRAGDEQVAVEVSDDGPGIPSPLLKRIFDPFFTTKRVGEGTGLGLSVVRQVVLRHGGQITVHSAPGSGARFTVTLPSAGARLGAAHVHG